MIERPPYPDIEEDETILDWFAGARIDYDKTSKTPMGDGADWSGGQACLGFSDIGSFGVDPRAQIVLHFVPFEDHVPNTGISLEVDRNDVVKLIARLSAWLATTPIDSLNEED